MSNGSDLISWMGGPTPGVKTGGDDPREFVFDRVLWDTAPQRLQADAASAYQKLGGSGAFGPLWSMKCGGETPFVRRFRLHMPPSEWEKPRGGIISALDRALWPYVSIVRQTEDDSDPSHATELDAPMQVLCLHGAVLPAGIPFDSTCAAMIFASDLLIRTPAVDGESRTISI